MSDPARLRSDLLPPNQSKLEAATAEAIAPACDPAIIANLWDAGRCPARLLPWLAWALSVDAWDAGWTEAQQRSTIAASIALHRKKGTPWAVKQALQRAGIPRVQLVEKPEGAHWAEFDIDVTVVDRPVDEAALSKVSSLIDAYKPVRSTLRRLVVSVGTFAAERFAAATLAGDVVTVYPFQQTEVEAPRSVERFAARAHAWETVTVYPAAP